MVFHNVFQRKNQVESSKTPPRALLITQISKMITPISIVPQCVSYLCNPSLIGGIRDFGTFPEISRRYFDPFDGAQPRSFRKGQRRRSGSTQSRLKPSGWGVEELTTSDYNKEKLQERLAKLAGGVAVIKVGAATETEMKEKKARVEDALNATRAAVEEGIVPGGGVAYLRCLPALKKIKVEGDQQTGVEIIQRALDEPIRQIAENAGQEGSVVAEKVKQGKGAFGFDAEKEEYTDMMEAGIIDPTKVVRLALRNAASVASLLITTEAVVAEKPKKEQGGPPMPPAY